MAHGSGWANGFGMVTIGVGKSSPKNTVERSGMLFGSQSWPFHVDAAVVDQPIQAESSSAVMPCAEEPLMPSGGGRLAIPIGVSRTMRGLVMKLAITPFICVSDGFVVGQPLTTVRYVAHKQTRGR